MNVQVAQQQKGRTSKNPRRQGHILRADKHPCMATF
jgi:hypothetical protein